METLKEVRDKLFKLRYKEKILSMNNKTSKELKEIQKEIKKVRNEYASLCAEDNEKGKTRKW